jgi:hypothetical protein
MDPTEWVSEYVSDRECVTCVCLVYAWQVFFCFVCVLCKKAMQRNDEKNRPNEDCAARCDEHTEREQKENNIIPPLYMREWERKNNERSEPCIYCIRICTTHTHTHSLLLSHSLNLLLSLSFFCSLSEVELLMETNFTIEKKHRLHTPPCSRVCAHRVCMIERNGWKERKRLSCTKKNDEKKDRVLWGRGTNLQTHTCVCVCVGGVTQWSKWYSVTWNGWWKGIW